jgi:hypothetical protein
MAKKDTGIKAQRPTKTGSNKPPSTLVAEPQGPFLAGAFVCEKVLEDKDKALSAIRIVDTFTYILGNDTPPDIPSEEKRLPVQITALLMFKSGNAPGEHSVRVVMVSPTGKINEEEAYTNKITFTDDEASGANITLHTTIAVIKGGVFWFNVYVDDKLVTRIPCRINVQRQESPPEMPSTTEVKKRTEAKKRV